MPWRTENTSPEGFGRRVCYSLTATPRVWFEAICSLNDTSRDTNMGDSGWINPLRHGLESRPPCMRMPSKYDHIRLSGDMDSINSSTDGVQLRYRRKRHTAPLSLPDLFILRSLCGAPRFHELDGHQQGIGTPRPLECTHNVRRAHDLWIANAH